MDDYPGIEIRCVSPEGLPYFAGNSNDLHYDLSAAWLHAGYPPDTWHPLISGYYTLEVRAVNLPAPPGAPDCPADLFRGQAGALAELAELERAAAGRADERAAAAGLEPPGDVDQAPGHSPCCCHGGFSGDHVCCIHPAAAGLEPPGDVDQAPDVEAGPVYLDTLGRIRPDDVDQAAAYGAAPGPLLGGDTGAACPGAGPGNLTERDQPTGPTRRRLRPGSAIARIARRARFLSDR